MSMKRTLLIFYVLSIGIITYGQKIVSTDVYKYPFKQDDAKWKSYKSARDRIEALQIPSVIVDSIETSLTSTRATRSGQPARCASRAR